MCTGPYTRKAASRSSQGRGKTAHLITSKSSTLRIASSSVTPKKKHVTRLRQSVIEVTSGTEPICQSCDKVAGHRSSHQLKAAK